MKYGRRPPKRALSLHLGNYLTGVIPSHPAWADYLAALNGGWQVLGNNQYGDCMSVTWANSRRLVTATLTGQVDYPSLDQVIAFYKTQNPAFPSEDNGMDMQTALETLVNEGGPDGVKAICFAQIDPTNVEEVKAAIAIFGFVYVGVNVQYHNMNEFDLGMPWTWSVSDGVDGGHAILTGGYGTPGPGALGGDERFITWGQETSFTDEFWQYGVEECWVVIWPEHLGTKEFMEGVNLQDLAADYEAITGKVLPLPAPPPAPAPAPAPEPVPTPTPKPAPPTPANKPDWWDDLIEWILALIK